MLGIANPTAAVEVDDGTSTYIASRKGEYFHFAFPVDNSSVSKYPTFTVTSTFGSEDDDSGEVFVAKTPEAYSHDSDGNLTQDGRWDYVWDGENRLSKLRSRSGSPAPERRIEFEYDYMGRRIRKQVFNDRDDGQGTELADTVFLYDGWNLLAELDANDSNAKIRTYVWGLDLSGTEQGAGGVGGLLKVKDYTSGTKHYFAAYDGNGNVMGLVDGADGSVDARYEYGPFGEPIRTTGPASPSPIQFSSKYTDEESGFSYYGYRSYNPNTGRWLNRDPIEERGGENIYCMVWNDLGSFWDYLGMGCKVTFTCSLRPGLPSRPSWGGLTQNCTYDCTENARKEVKGVTTVTCADLPKSKIRISVDQSFFCKKCPPTMKETRLFESEDLKIDCSRAACRSGCDASFAVLLKSKNPAVRAAAIAGRQLCYDSCNSVCRKE